MLLRYRFGAGDGWRWHLERSMRFEAHRGDGLAMLARAFLGGAEEVSASADVDFAVEEVTSGARSAVRVGPAGAGVLIEADPLGRRRIIASQGGGRLAEALRPERGFHFAAAELAPRMALGPVRPGEAWKHSAKGTVLKARGGRLVLKLDLLIEYRLADQQPAGRGGREVVIEQKVVRRDFELVDAERGRALVTARSTGSGRAVFDPLAGALMSSELELRTTFSPGGLGKGRRLGEISYTETISLRLATDGR